MERQQPLLLQGGGWRRHRWSARGLRHGVAHEHHDESVHKHRRHRDHQLREDGDGHRGGSGLRS